MSVPQTAEAAAVTRLVAPVVEMRVRGFVCVLGTLVFVAISVDVAPAPRLGFELGLAVVVGLALHISGSRPPAVPFAQPLIHHASRSS